jgi:hypothetical protein
VRYLYTTGSDSIISLLSAQLKLTEPITKLAGPVKDAAGNLVSAYRLPGDIRAAWVATAMVKAPEQQALATVLDPRFDPARVAIIDSGASIQAQALQTLPAAATTHATVTTFAPGAYDIALDQPAAAGEALVVSENYFPGWHATADGKPAAVARANFNLIGVALPAGARSIQVRFTDAAYEKGKVLTLVALAIALLVWIGGWIAERRHGTPEAATA